MLKVVKIFKYVGVCLVFQTLKEYLVSERVVQIFMQQKKSSDFVDWK